MPSDDAEVLGQSYGRIRLCLDVQSPLNRCAQQDLVVAVKKEEGDDQYDDGQEWRRPGWRRRHRHLIHALDAKKAQDGARREQGGDERKAQLPQVLKDGVEATNRRSTLGQLLLKRWIVGPDPRRGCWQPTQVMLQEPANLGASLSGSASHILLRCEPTSAQASQIGDYVLSRQRSMPLFKVRPEVGPNHRVESLLFPPPVDAVEDIGCGGGAVQPGSVAH